MKKIIAVILLTLVFTGCGSNLMNTPTKKVEAMLNNYITLDSKVIEDLDETLLTETIMNNDQKEHYKKILKRQYQNLSYTIKDETIDGDKATVEVEINVYDYYKINKESEAYLNNNIKDFTNEDGTKNLTKYNDYKLDNLDKAKDKITYTLNLTLHKTSDNWVLDYLTDVEISKIHGLYAY